MTSWMTLRSHQTPGCRSFIPKAKKCAKLLDLHSEHANRVVSSQNEARRSQQLIARGCAGGRRGKVEILSGSSGDYVMQAS